MDKKNELNCIYFWFAVRFLKIIARQVWIFTRSFVCLNFFHNAIFHLMTSKLSKKHRFKYRNEKRKTIFHPTPSQLWE
jgi:hypothetical protein